MAMHSGDIPILSLVTSYPADRKSGEMSPTGNRLRPRAVSVLPPARFANAKAFPTGSERPRIHSTISSALRPKTDILSQRLKFMLESAGSTVLFCNNSPPLGTGSVL